MTPFSPSFYIDAKAKLATVLLVTVLSVFTPNVPAIEESSLQEWVLNPPDVSLPDGQSHNNVVNLGKMLFFDPRLSDDGSISCSSCHSPSLGWSNGLKTAVGIRGTRLRRASPSLINSIYGSRFNWDGSARSLEQQAMGPLLSPQEMGGDLANIINWLQNTPGYKQAFDLAYPDRGITPETITGAIAEFERTILQADSPFDRWVQGDPSAMTRQQIRGFEIFSSEDKGNCTVCHSAPNFTDDSFHNIGLESTPGAGQDLGRFEIVPVAVLKGAFKTPALRGVSRTAPYFHDGSARTLEAVVEHYVRGGDDQSNLSPDLKPLELTDEEKSDLVAFLKALDSSPKPFSVPVLPSSADTPSSFNLNKSGRPDKVLADIDE